VAIDTSVAAIRILNVVIVILRHVVCGEFAPAITAARLRAFPLRDFLDSGYVGVASKKAHQANITVARTVLDDEAPIMFDQHFNSVDNGLGVSNAIAGHRPKK
jgi:hypothetical protein